METQFKLCGDRFGYEDRPRTTFTEEQWRCITKSLELSGRQIQIVRHIFEDRKELAIARELGISPHTVHTHTERLYHKLGVTSRVSLIVRVFTEACQRCRQQMQARACPATPPSESNRITDELMTCRLSPIQPTAQ